MTGGPPRRAADVLDAVLDGEVVLYLVATGVPLLLNTSAARVWALIDGTTTVDEIVGVLADAHAVGAAEIAPDVESTVQRLVDLGAVTYVAPR